jgi:hypothetical protein
MSQEPNANTLSLDLIRWTFTSDPEHSSAIEEYLVDQGLDVLRYEECKFMVTWDEPDGDVEAIIGEIWALNGTPFEVTHEEFHRLGLNTLYHTEEGSEAAA